MSGKPVKLIPAMSEPPEEWLTRKIDRSKYERTVDFAVPISPALADVMLLRNDGNRRIFQAHVKKLSNAMERGEWIATHAGIAFDRNGRLLDGQHRLCAIRASGITVPLDVHFGEAPEAFDRIDVGRARSAANLLEIGGHKNATMVAAIGRVLLSVDANLIYVDRYGHTNHTLIEYVSERPEIVDAAMVASATKEAIGRMHSPAGYGAAVYIIRKAAGDGAESFFEKVRTQLGFKEFDAAYRLHQRLTKGQTGKLNAMEVCALTIKAFNYWREGKAVKVLLWRPVDEEFPKIGKDG